MYRNYVYDTDRRYQRALAEGLADTETRRLYEQFESAKLDYSKAEDALRVVSSLADAGNATAWYEKQQARRKMNAAETSMMSLSRRIAERIRQSGGGRK